MVGNGYNDPLMLSQVDDYLGERNGSFEQRSVRFVDTVQKLYEWNISDKDTIIDIGAGWTELDYFLRKDLDWRGRYYPIDAGLDSTNLELWKPARSFEYVIGLEILEHLYDPERLLRELILMATKGVICSVPNPETVDVLAIDRTHYSTPNRILFEDYGFTVVEKTFYGGYYSNGKPDALFAFLKK